ncbi:phage tail protein [Halomonas sp.]|uniref:phage tail protein n=1 Tax=Halomonas sp. TaxID=1486246 RepID=UPI000C8FCB2E|nr:phage tail protein [Halomonas sp.]MAR71148.1 hypothetical protein [Halomonas sp.]|tara:strand:+ start:4446 stop:6242 length:1797 start_codon:yes stop_codon:yes gene_type:complete
MPQFYTLLTDSGQAKIANAVALGAQIEITQMAVGDGGGNPVTPDSSATVLVNEVRRAPINAVHTDDDNPTWIVIEQVLPPDVGGWTIREVGVFDAAGDLIAIGNLPETYKPVLAEGSSRTQTIRVVMEVSDTAAVTLKVDPSVVLATREYVDQQRLAHEQSRNHPAATETAQGMLEIANDEEALEGADDTRAMTSEKVHAAFKQFGIGEGPIDIADFTSRLVNVARVFRQTASAVGGPGETSGMLSLPIDGSPSHGFIGVGSGFAHIGFKSGEESTPTWLRLLSETDKANDEQAKAGNSHAKVMTPANVRAAFGQYGLGEGADMGTINVETLVNPGMYFVKSGSPEIPLNEDSALIVAGTKEEPSQILISTRTGRLFARSSYKEGSDHYWNSWIDISSSHSDLQKYESAGTYTFTVPSVLKNGIKKAKVTVIGGGAGGGHSETATAGGAGGGGGGAAYSYVDLTGVDTVAVTVGEGGAGKSAGSTGAGGVGGTSSFGPYLSCTGGSGGSIPSAGSSGYASGSSFVVLDVSSASVSSNTQDGTVTTGSGGGYGGAGAAAVTRPKGESGKGYGGGGAGGTGTSGTRGGGDGADGAVIIEW